MQNHTFHVRTDIWREGKYLDLWSVPHALSGALVGLGAYMAGFSLLAASLIAFLIFVVYEMFEVIAKIEETRINRTLDVVVGMAGFFPAFYIAALFSDYQLIAGFIAIGVVDCVLSFFGWRESHKAAVLEEKFRAEIEGQRKRIKVRRAERRKKRAAGQFKGMDI